MINCFFSLLIFDSCFNACVLSLLSAFSKRPHSTVLIVASPVGALHGGAVGGAVAGCGSGGGAVSGSAVPVFLVVLASASASFCAQYRRFSLLVSFFGRVSPLRAPLLVLDRV